MERTIRVTGKGMLRLTPDRIRLVISMTGIRKEYEKAVEQSTEDSRTLAECFEKIGFERRELNTTYYNVNAEYESYQDKDHNWKNRFKGYRYNRNMKLEFPLDNELLGKVLYAVAHCSVEVEFNIEYTVAEPEKAKNELLNAAVKDAQEKAAVLSDAAGIRLGRLMNLDYSWSEMEIVARDVRFSKAIMTESAMDSAAGYNVDVNPDDIEVNDSVTMVWEIG